jgi:hypothetical protein
MGEAAMKAADLAVAESAQFLVMTFAPKHGGRRSTPARQVRR